MCDHLCALHQRANFTLHTHFILPPFRDNKRFDAFREAAKQNGWQVQDINCATGVRVFEHRPTMLHARRSGAYVARLPMRASAMLDRHNDFDFEGVPVGHTNSPPCG
jgi:hypothetical protein